MLDVSALRGIVSYEPSELVVTVRAGTPLAELEAELAEHGQSLAFEPPCFSLAPDLPSRATCGGMVASGLSGPARASVGGVRDFVLGVKLINGRGELLTFGGQVIKNVAGYDVSRLMVGAMGTLGLMTEISLKVLPLAPAEATLVFELDQTRALAQLHRWGAQPLPLNASCWVRDDTAPGSPGALAAVCAPARCGGGGGVGLPPDDPGGTRYTHGQRRGRARLATLPQPEIALFHTTRGAEFGFVAAESAPNRTPLTPCLCPVR